MIVGIWNLFGDCILVIGYSKYSLKERLELNKGLIFLKNNAQDDVLLDADNLFWAITAKDRERNSFISRRIFLLYEKVKENLDADIKEFRFSQGLTAIYIDPTDRCNSNCPYCYIPAKIRKNGRSMTDGELTFTLNKISEYFKNRKRKAVVVFHAAEPLLVKDIVFKAIEDFSGRFHFGLQTNGMLLEEEDVEFLKEYRVGVGISLDSSEPKVNKRSRPSAQSDGNFNKAVKAIEQFDGYPGLNVITTITKLNVAGLPRLVEFLHTKRVPCVLLNPVRLTQKPARALKPDERLLTRRFIEAVDRAIELSSADNHRIIIGNFTNVILAIVAPTARRLMCDISPCGGGRCFLTITANGDMIPCGEFIGLRGFSGGNIFKTAISDAMQSPPFRTVRSRFVEKIPECDTCIFRNICGAPCPAELHSLGGMYKKSVFCDFYKEIIKYAFKLISEGKEAYCMRKDSISELNYLYRLR